jgi:hypothetical protein
MPNMFTNEYANMHSIHDFWDGNENAAVVEYQRYTLYRIPHRKILENIHRTLRELVSSHEGHEKQQQV